MTRTLPAMFALAVLSVMAMPREAAAEIIDLAAVTGATATTSPVASGTLAAGTYSLTEAGIAGGGQFDAYTIYAPTPTNNAYKADYYVDVGGATTWINTGSAYDTAAQALAAYQALPAFVFTLTAPTTVSAYLADYGYPYFGDDSGGVSLSLNQVAVPEPASVAMLGMGLLGLTALMRNRRKAGF